MLWRVGRDTERINLAITIVLLGKQIWYGFADNETVARVATTKIENAIILNK